MYLHLVKLKKISLLKTIVNRSLPQPHPTKPQKDRPSYCKQGGYTKNHSVKWKSNYQCQDHQMKKSCRWHIMIYPKVILLIFQIWGPNVNLTQGWDRHQFSHMFVNLYKRKIVLRTDLDKIKVRHSHYTRLIYQIIKFLQNNFVSPKFFLE